MALNICEGDLQVKGQLVPQSISYPPAGITDAAIAALAAIAASKLQHEHRKEYSQEASANNAAETKGIFIARFAGNVVAFQVELILAPDTAAGSSGRTATVDLKKNGTSILSAPITLNSINTPYVAVNATISTPGYSAGDSFTVVVANGGSVGTYPKGVTAQATFNEAGA